MTLRKYSFRKNLENTLTKKLYGFFLALFLIIFFLVSFLSFPDKLHGQVEEKKEVIEIDENLYETGILSSGNNKNTGISYSDIIAESAIVMDYKTGDVLWKKNHDKKLFPASTTKILSTIVAIENIGNFNEIIEISRTAAGKNHSAFRFRAGDKISLMDLVKASLIISHNNATVALAEYISGSEEEFLEIMNLKAREIGAYNSFFQNTNGLDSDYPFHKSTAEDIAIIARYSLKNALFRKIVNTDKDFIEINGQEIELNNTNKLLNISYIKGIKTGYTLNAGYCIVLYSEKNDLELITVILNSTKNGRERDVIKLLNWVYENFAYEKIVDSDKVIKTFDVEDMGPDKESLTTVSVNLYPESDYTRLVNKGSDKIDLKYIIDDNIALPIVKNQKMGILDIYINEEKIEEINIISKDSIPKPFIYQELTSLKEIQSRKILIILLSIYFFIFIFIIVKNLITIKRRNL